MNQSIDLDLTSASINEITARHPGTITVFNDFGVDACCGGDATLAEATQRDGVDLDALTQALVGVITGASQEVRA